MGPDQRPVIECPCGFVTNFNTTDANIAALEVHAPNCPETFGEPPKQPMSWAQAVAVSAFMLAMVGMVWAIAWAAH